MSVNCYYPHVDTFHGDGRKKYILFGSFSWSLDLRCLIKLTVVKNQTDRCIYVFCCDGSQKYTVWSYFLRSFYSNLTAGNLT